jgi:hypothetical protein
MDLIRSMGSALNKIGILTLDKALKIWSKGSTAFMETVKMSYFRKRAGFKYHSVFAALWIGLVFLIISLSSSAWAQTTPSSSETPPTTTAPATNAPTTATPTATAPVTTAPAKTAATPSETIKTLNDLAPFIADIPGLDSLPVSNVEVTDDVTSATITLKGIETTVVGFKIGDNKQVALIPKTFAFNEFMPGVADDVLSKIALTNTVLILNKPGGDPADVNTSDLPKAVSSAIGEGSETMTLKSGVNFRGKLDVQASGEIADLLSNIGVSEVKLPLNGSFDPAAFKKDTSSAKDKILDNLDIKAALPDLSIPGLPSSVAIKNGHFSIEGKKNGDKREIDVGVDGELTASVGSTDVDFTFDITSAKTQDSKADVTINGSSKKTLTLPGFQALALTGLTFTASRVDDKWDAQVDAKSTLKDKEIDVTLTRPADGDQVVTINTKLTLTDLAGVNIPGLSDIEFDSAVIKKASAVITGKVKGLDTDLEIFKPGGSGKNHVGISFGNFTVATFIPQVAGTPLADEEFDDVTLLWAPTGTSLTSISDGDSAVPEQLVTDLKKAGDGPFKVGAGLNMFGSLKIKSGSQVASMLSKVGMTDATLPLRGKLSAAIFQKTPGQSTKDKILDDLDIHSALPNLSIPGLPSSVSIKNGHFSVEGKKDANNRRVMDVGVDGELTAKLGSTDVDFTFEIEAAKTQGQKADITINAESQAPVTLPGFQALALTDMTLTASRADNKWDVKVDAKSTLKNKPIDVTVTRADGKQVVTINTKLTLTDLAGVSIPGLSDIEFDSAVIKKASAVITGKVKGLDTDLEIFKPGGTGKNHVGISFGNFTVATFIPQVAGTPLADEEFDDVTLLWAPTGTSLTSITDSDTNVPTALVTDLKKAGKGPFKVGAGLNIFGSLKIKSGSQVANMLSKVGVTDANLPLRGKLSAAIFQKTPGQSAKDKMLDDLDIQSSLPNLSVPGLPSMITMKDGHFAIKGKKVGNKREIDVSVSGEMDVKLGSKEIDFTFDIAVAKPANSRTDLIIHADSDKKVTVPFFKPLELDKMILRANLSKGTWYLNINAKSKLNNKPIDLDFIKIGKAKPSLYITTKLTLADLSPISIPGLTDIELDRISMYPDNTQLFGKIKGMPVEMALFKRGAGNKTHVGLSIDKLDISKIIPGAGSTPLKDIDFVNPTMIWVPKGAAETGVDANTMPYAVSRPLDLQGSPKLDLKAGLNLFATAKLSGGVVDMLKKVGINKTQFHLKGKLSPAVFKKGGGAQIKNAILDGLDIKMNLPDLSIPGLPNTVSIKHGHFAIKGKRTGDTREIDVGVTGELVAKLHGTDVDFEFDAEMKKPVGKPAELSITGHTEPGKRVTLNLIHPFHLDTLKFAMDKEKAGWKWQVDAKTKLHSKPLDVSYIHDPAKASGPDGPNHLSIHTKITVAEMIGQANLPGLDDIHVSWVEVYSKYFRASLGVKGTYFYVNIFKPQGASKHIVAVTLGPETISPDKFIPGTSNTPLKDVTFNGMSFVYAPSGLAGKLPRSQMPRDLKYRLRPGWIPGDITLKSGLNVFGKLEVHPTGEMASLLKKVNITDLVLPLRGGFSKKAFSGNLSSIKDEILEHLDINTHLPTPSIPGLSSIVTFHNGHLKIKGKKNKQGQRELDIAVSGDADVHIKSEKFAFFLDVERDKSASGTEIKINGHTDRKWTHPFGIHWLDLDKLTLDIDKKTKDGVTNWDIDVKAKADVGSHTHLDVMVDVHEKNGSVTDVYFELDGPIELSQIPEINRIPHADKYAIKKIKASEHGVEARTTIGGRETDAFLFEGSGWNFAITQKNFAATEFISALKDTPLKFIKFPFIAVMLSETGINKPMSELSIIAQDAFKEVLGANDQVNIKKGLAFIAGFHPDSAGSMKDAVKGIGIHESVTIMGEIGGMFGGPPSVTLVGKLTPGPAHNMPKSMKAKTTEEVDFFLNVLESGQDFDFELGMAVGVHTTIKGDRLFFDTKVKVQIMDEGFGIDVEGQMKGLWHKPFGIPGFTMGDVTIEVGTQEDGAIKMGFAGTTILGGDKFTIAGDGEFLPEALGAPQAIAFKASADMIPMFFLEQIVLSMAAKEVHLDIPNGMLPEFKKVVFAFCTPGAEDPDLNITGEGFAMKGGLSWLGHELGKVDVSVSPTSGIVADGKIDDINLGPLHLKDNVFDMKVPFTNLPTLKVHSNLAFLGIKERFKIDFNKSGIKIDAHSDFGPDFSANFDLTLSGVNLDVKKPGFKDADFAMEGDFKLDIGKFIAGPAKKDMDEIFDELDKNFKKAEDDVKHWRKKVDGLNTKINAERAKVRRERAAAERRLQSAENRVNSLNGRVNNDWHHYHHCHGWGKWACKAKWGIRARFMQGVRWVAVEALRAVEELVDHFPIDLDPRIAVLIGLKDAAQGSLTIALYAIEGADELDRLLKLVGDALLKPLQSKAVANSININKASFKGDLRGVIEHDTPVDLGLDAELFGLHIKENFAFKIKDLAYDLEQLGVMGLMALEHLVEKGLGEISGAIKHKFHAVVSRKIEAKQAAHKREMAKYGKDFTKYNKQAQAMQARLLALGAAELKVKLMENTSPLDTDGNSLRVNNEYLEVGHTGLCLTNEGGVVTQHPCDGEKASQQKWQTSPIGKGHGVPEGYVSFYNEGKCLYPEGQWETVQKKIGGFTLPIQEFQGDGRLITGACAYKKQDYWKVLKHGDGWMQIANRATNKCLHFTDGDARPGKAKAEWQACTGTANQVFRIADKVTPKFHKANIALKNDSRGLCFGIEAGKYIQMNECNRDDRYDYMIDIRGNIKFISTLTGKCIQPESYKSGAVLVERTCTQLDYQWWVPMQVPGGWAIKNAQTHFCTQAIGGPGGRHAIQVACESWSMGVITPLIDEESGIHLRWISSHAFPGGEKFDAAYTIKERIPEFTREKHAQEIAEINRLKNDERWAERYRHPERSAYCNSLLNFWRWREGFWWARAEAEFWYAFTLRQPYCRVKEVPDWWVKNRVQHDDFEIRVLQQKLRKNARPAPEPKWYLCSGAAPNGSSIPGVVENRRCTVNYNGRNYHSDSYNIVMEATYLEWKHGGGGHVPDLAIPMGWYESANHHRKTAYSCRTMINDKTRIGSTTDGRYCWYTHGNNWGGARNFEILTRKPWAAYKFDLTN